MRSGVIGDHIIELEVCDSTNKYAADLLAVGEAAHGTVILAHEQTAGTGQRGRVWISGPRRDIAMSIVLMPERMKASEQFALAQVAALAVHDVVTEAMRASVGRHQERVRIKWPNDVLIDRRKVAGILVQNEVSGQRLTSSVIGIGMNVNSNDLEADFNATSLRMETATEHDRMQLVRELSRRVQHWWNTHLTRPAELGTRYAELLWSKGRFADLELDGEPFSARPMGVDADGRLLVEDENGQVAAHGLDRLRFAHR